VHDGSDVTYRIDSGDDVYLTLSGTQGQPFDLYFNRGALRNFLTQGTEALARMETLVAEQGA
jgi:hypothetical protein